MSLSLKPEPRDTLIMMATGADAAKRKATKAQKGGKNLALEVFNTGTPNF